MKFRVILCLHHFSNNLVPYIRQNISIWYDPILLFLLESFNNLNLLVNYAFTTSLIVKWILIHVFNSKLRSLWSFFTQIHWYFFIFTTTRDTIHLFPFKQCPIMDEDLSIIRSCHSILIIWFASITISRTFLHENPHITFLNTISSNSRQK